MQELALSFQKEAQRSVSSQKVEIGEELSQQVEGSWGVFSLRITNFYFFHLSVVFLD